MVFLWSSAAVMATWALIVLVVLGQVAANGLPGWGQKRSNILPFTVAAEVAVKTMPRPVIVKVDSQICGDCLKLDEFWGIAGQSLPEGTIWQVDCDNSEADNVALCDDADWDRRLPRFEAWDGKAWKPYRGKPALENLQDWMMTVLQLSPTIPQVHQPSQPTPPPTHERESLKRDRNPESFDELEESLEYDEEDFFMMDVEDDDEDDFYILDYGDDPFDVEDYTYDDDGQEDAYYDNDDYHVDEYEDNEDAYYYEEEEEEENYEVGAIEGDEDEFFLDEEVHEFDDEYDYGHDNDDGEDVDKEYNAYYDDEEASRKDDGYDKGDSNYEDRGEPNNQFGSSKHNADFHESTASHSSDDLGSSVQQPLSQIYSKEFFEQFRAYGDAYPALARAISKHMPRDASIVDVGCGHGFLVEALRTSGFAHSYGIEGSVSAKDMWPEPYKNTYYKLQDLSALDATIPETDFVSTFEVAEHLPPSRATHFVQLLTKHRPRLIFFGAATSFQDRGRNPGHLNEQPIQYWVERFEKEGYVLDAARSAALRVGLLSDDGYKMALQTGKAWWFVKNVVVFADIDFEEEMEDQEEDVEYIEEDVDAEKVRAEIDEAIVKAPWSKLLASFKDNEASLGAVGEALLAAHFASSKIDGHGILGPETGQALGKMWISMYDRNREIGPMWRRDWAEFATLYNDERRKALKRLRTG